MRAPPADARSRRATCAPLLDEEAAHWGSELLWDYSEVCAGGARAGSTRRTLPGACGRGRRAARRLLLLHPESGRAIVGSLFAADAGARPRLRGGAAADAVLADAPADGDNDARRVPDALLDGARRGRRASRRPASARSPRHYLRARARAESRAAAAPRWRLRPVRQDDLGRAAELIYRSHHGSLDAALNLTYATPAYCRGFVETLVLRAGCGRFDSEASFLVETGATARAGVLLASRLSRSNGHICQVSVLPERAGPRAWAARS